MWCPSKFWCPSRRNPPQFIILKTSKSEPTLRLFLCHLPQDAHNCKPQGRGECWIPPGPVVASKPWGSGAGGDVFIRFPPKSLYPRNAVCWLKFYFPQALFLSSGSRPVFFVSFSSSLSRCLHPPCRAFPFPPCFYILYNRCCRRIGLVVTLVF